MVALKALQRTSRLGKRTRIGLDIGASGVRAVQLTHSAGAYRVECAACADRSRIAADESEDFASLVRQIEGCLHKRKFRGRTVAAALSPPDVEFHALELPAAVLRAEEHDAAQIVRFEVERLMTQPQTEVETRHWGLPETTLPAPNAIGAGAAQGIITRTIEACARAGLTCSDLDTTATALSRFGAVLQDRPQDRVWGVLDVGDRQARLVLCLDDTPILVRTAGAGGNAWTQRIADALQVSFKAAEIHKRDHGIALTGRVLVRESILAPTDEGARSELASLILGAVRADLNDLAAEVKRSYEYVLSCYPGRQAADLVLCGGGSGLHNFPEFLANALGIPVQRASSYLQGDSCRLRFVSERVGRRDQGGSVHTPLEVLAVAVGLAISEPEAEATGPQRGTEARRPEGTKRRRALIRTSNFELRTSVNLIPERMQTAQTRRRHLQRWAACLAITALVAVVPIAAHWMQHLRVDELHAQNDKLQTDLAAARAELKTATAAANDAFMRIERANALRSKRAWSGMLALIGSCLPKDCRLTALATDPDVPSAAPVARKAPPPAATPGTAAIETTGPILIDAPRKLRLSGSAADATQPLLFVAMLKESHVFREVTLERCLREKPEDESHFRFELLCEW